MVDVAIVVLILRRIPFIEKVIPLNFDINAHLFKLVVLERLQAEMIRQPIGHGRMLSRLFVALSIIF